MSPDIDSAYRRGLEGWIGRIEKRVDLLQERVRNTEENVRNVQADCKEWEPIINAARDQDYLRSWVQKQEQRTANRWKLFIAVAGLLATWTAVVVAITGLILSQFGHPVPTGH